jgi:hypothetical protein
VNRLARSSPLNGYGARITATASSPKVSRSDPAAVSLNSGDHTMAGGMFPLLAGEGVAAERPSKSRRTQCPGRAESLVTAS